MDPVSTLIRWSSDRLLERVVDTRSSAKIPSIRRRHPMIHHSTARNSRLARVQIRCSATTAAHGAGAVSRLFITNQTSGSWNLGSVAQIVRARFSITREKISSKACFVARVSSVPYLYHPRGTVAPVKEREKGKGRTNQVTQGVSTSAWNLQVGTTKQPYEDPTRRKNRRRG